MDKNTTCISVHVNTLLLMIICSMDLIKTIVCLGLCTYMLNTVK